MRTRANTKAYAGPARQGMASLVVCGVLIGDMSKPPAKDKPDAASALSIAERLLLFCVASGTKWERAGIADGDKHDGERSHSARSRRAAAADDRSASRAHGAAGEGWLTAVALQ
jgi:hypothetical protein